MNKKIKFNIKKFLKFKAFFKADEGFTLLELLVAMSIIIIMSAVTVANIKVGNDRQALLRSTQKFAFDIRKVQNLALSPKKYGTNPVCFYGIKIESSTSYFLYYDDRSNCNAGVTRFSGQSTKIDPQPVFLESGIEFADTVNKEVTFVPPEPISYFFGNANNFPQNIVLRITQNITDTRTVTINKFGNIEIQ